MLKNTYADVHHSEFLVCSLCCCFFLFFRSCTKKVNYWTDSESNFNWKDLAHNIMRCFSFCFLAYFLLINCPHDWRQQRSDQLRYRFLSAVVLQLLLSNLADPAMKFLARWGLIHAWRVSFPRIGLGVLMMITLLSCEEHQDKMEHGTCFWGSFCISWFSMEWYSLALISSHFLSYKKRGWKEKTKEKK